MTKLSHSWAKANLEARITAHVHAWEKAKQAGQPLAPETFPFVTVSRDFGCEALPLSARLVEILNERCRPFFTWVAYDKEVLDQVADELHLRHGVVESIDGKRRSEMTGLFDSILNTRVNDTVLFRKLAEVIRSLAIHGHTVMVGRGSQLITQDLKTGLHVRLVAPIRWRIQRIAAECGLSHAEAQQLVEDSARQRDQFVETFFVHDPEHPFYYDLIIDNSRFNLDQIAEIVFTALCVRFGPTLVGA